MFYVTVRFSVVQIPSRSPKGAGARATQVSQTGYGVTTSHSILEKSSQAEVAERKALTLKYHWRANYICVLLTQTPQGGNISSADCTGNSSAPESHTEAIGEQQPERNELFACEPKNTFYCFHYALKAHIHHRTFLRRTPPLQQPYTRYSRVHSSKQKCTTMYDTHSSVSGFV